MIDSSTDGLRKAARRVLWEANRLDKGNASQHDIHEIVHSAIDNFIKTLVELTKLSEQRHRLGHEMPNDEIGRWGKDWEEFYAAQLQLLSQTQILLDHAKANNYDYCLAINDFYGKIYPTKGGSQWE